MNVRVVLAKIMEPVWTESTAFLATVQLGSLGTSVVMVRFCRNSNLLTNRRLPTVMEDGGGGSWTKLIKSVQVHTK